VTLAAPALVFVYASGWTSDWLALAAVMAYWCLPQIFFYIVYAVLAQVLNARSVFGWPAWAPAISNLVAIGGVFVFIAAFPSGRGGVTTWTPTMIAVLCGTATLSIAVQALVLIRPLKKIGFRFRPQWGVAGLGHTGKIALWTFLGVAAGQLAFVVLSNAATRAGQTLHTQGIDGASLNSYGYAFLLVYLPHGIATVSLATAMFTRLSQSAAAGKYADVAQNLARTSTLVTSICVATTAVFVVAGPLITQVLWGTPVIGEVLRPLSLGLLGISQTYVYSRGLFALHNGFGPFLAQAAAAAISAIGAALAGVLLPPPLVVIGIAVAVALSNLAAWGMVYLSLKVALGKSLGAPARLLPDRKFVLASVVSFVVAVSLGRWSLWALGFGLGMNKVLQLLILMLVAAVMIAGFVVGDYLIQRRPLWRALRELR
ncbi:MAG: hypothetical protein H7248_03840, partial [Microbacteriaceae bacterium]|nr:hypothetical protein [Microbacteriaceae bacterium]